MGTGGMNKMCIRDRIELYDFRTVTSTGIGDGTEIVQLYLRDVMAEVARPVKELKAFRLSLIHTFGD